VATQEQYQKRMFVPKEKNKKKQFVN